MSQTKRSNRHLVDRIAYHLSHVGRTHDLDSHDWTSFRGPLASVVAFYGSIGAVTGSAMTLLSHSPAHSLARRVGHSFLSFWMSGTASAVVVPLSFCCLTVGISWLIYPPWLSTVEPEQESLEDHRDGAEAEIEQALHDRRPGSMDRVLQSLEDRLQGVQATYDRSVEVANELHKRVKATVSAMRVSSVVSAGIGVLLGWACSKLLSSYWTKIPEEEE